MAQLKLLPIFCYLVLVVLVLCAEAQSDFELVVYLPLVGEENFLVQWLRPVVSVPVVPYSFALYTL